MLCALSVLFQENRATEWASHGFAVLFMISNETHRLRPTRICCALHDYQGNSQIAPHTDSLCSVLFQENRATDCAPHGFAVLCALSAIFQDNRATVGIFQENRATESPTRICCALHDYQGNSQIAPHTDSLCSVCYFPPHRFAALFIISNEIHRLRPTRIHCTLHVFQENS